MSSNIGAMLEELREKEVSLRHAVIIDDTVVYDSTHKRKILSTRVHHYLSCAKCRLRALLDLPKEEVSSEGRVINAKSL